MKKLKSKEGYYSGGPIKELIDPVNVKSFSKEKLKAVQLDLKNRGHYTGEIDGVYGPLTDQAINTYNVRRSSPNKVLPEFNVIGGRNQSSATT